MAPKKSQKKGGKSKPRSSAAKVANKKLNKFAKQGKLRKQRLKQKKKELKKTPSDSAERPLTNGHLSHNKSEISEDEETDRLQEEDIKFYMKQNVISAQFAVSSLPRKNRKRRHEPGDEDDSSKFEKAARIQFPGDSQHKMKMLLPIKDKGRVIPQMMKVEEDEAEGSSLDETVQHNSEKSLVTNHSPEPSGATENAEEPLPLLSEAEQMALRKKKLDDRKQKIAELATAVIENPEENMSKMRELRKLLGESDSDLCLTVRKLTMVSMCEIFRDIIPGYRIRLPNAKEKEQRMKQETKKLMDYEAALLLSYKTYLEYLEYTIKGKSFENCLRLKRLGFCDVALPQQNKKDLAAVALQCMCKLLTTHPHFNYRSDVITFLMPFMNHKNHKFSDTVCQAVKEIFVRDKSGEVILEIVKAIAKLVKSRKFDVQPKVLQPLLSLSIKEIDMNKTTGNKKMNRKEKFQKLSRRDRKRLKQSEELEKELQETQATQDKQQRLKVHTQIVEIMFTTFFNVLKREDKSPLLAVVLQSLARFTHLISVDFFHDLYSVFNKLIESGSLSQLEILHCVQTAFQILSGQGTTLNIDPVKFYTHLYIAMLSVHAGATPLNATTVVDCLDAAIIRRKKQVTQQRVLAFIKRLTTMCLYQLPDAASAYLAIARCLVSIFPYADILYDQEAEGNGVYMPYLQEPEHCHANSSVVWEIHALRKHFHPDVKRLATNLLHKNSSDHSALSKKTPAEVYSHIHDQELFPAKLPGKAVQKTKILTNGFRSQEFHEELWKKYPQLLSEP